MSAETRAAGAANWVWLLELERRERALVIADRNSNAAAVLERHFRSVESIATAFLQVAIAKASSGGRSMRLPAEDASMDCVVLQDFVGDWKAIGSRRPIREVRAAVLRECRRVLRGGGVLVVNGGNPRWYARKPLRRSWIADLRLTAALSDAGFARVRRYWIDPSQAAPRSIIPATRKAVTAYERQERTIRGRAPRLLVALGLQALVYPALMLVAFT